MTNAKAIRFFKHNLLICHEDKEAEIFIRNIIREAADKAPIDDLKKIGRATLQCAIDIEKRRRHS